MSDDPFAAPGDPFADVAPPRPDLAPGEVPSVALVLREPGQARPTDVVDVISGTILSLDAPDDDLIALRLRVTELRAALADVNAAIDDEVRRRMDKDSRWTREAFTMGVKASAPSPDEQLVVPDPAELNTLLQRMLDADEITAAAKFAAIAPRPVEYDVKLAGLKALLKREELRERLATVARMEPRARRPVQYKRVSR